MKDAKLGQICLHCGLRPARHLNRLGGFEADCLMFCSIPCAAVFGHILAIDDSTRWCPTCNSWTQALADSSKRECCEDEPRECPHGQDLSLQNDGPRPCFLCEVAPVGALPLAVPSGCDIAREAFYCGNRCAASHAIESAGDGSYYWCHECGAWVKSDSGKYAQKDGECPHSIIDEDGKVFRGAAWPVLTTAERPKFDSYIFTERRNGRRIIWLNENLFGR
jgi:hypothetical protein